MVHYCKKKLKSFHWTKNFEENTKQIFSSFKRFGKHTGFKYI